MQDLHFFMHLFTFDHRNAIARSCAYQENVDMNKNMHLTKNHILRDIVLRRISIYNGKTSEEIQVGRSVKVYHQFDRKFTCARVKTPLYSHGNYIFLQPYIVSAASRQHLNQR